MFCFTVISMEPAPTERTQPVFMTLPTTAVPKIPSKPPTTAADTTASLTTHQLTTGKCFHQGAEF